MPHVTVSTKAHASTTSIWRRLLAPMLLVFVALLAAGCDAADDIVPAPVETVVVERSGYTVTYTTGDCPFFFDADVDRATREAISCGYMQVPQDRNEPDGLQVEIAVAIVQSVSDEPLADPIVYFEGGPGGGALYSAEYWLDSSLREDRQIILFDQRGTGYSWPNLGCPEVYEDDVLDAEDTDAYLDGLRACRDRLLDLGADLADYHSAIIAEDVADLRQVLGVESWNLYGISYGTRLALTVLRDRPEGVRSVVLDSVYPPNVDAYAEQSNTFGEAIDLLLDGCAEDEDCADAFPDLRQNFYDLILSLDAEPLVFAAEDVDTDEDVEVDAYTFVSQLTGALYDTELIPLLPRLIDDTFNGDYDLLLDEFLLYEEDAAYRQRPDDDEPVDEASLSDAEGMFYSVE
ncbi:MAG: alpha/beta fold hydrolase, partial [Caldilineaceae bacterium]|nr:alpha/beta fold hydrolase [Caldilineaceae bacterium]